MPTAICLGAGGGPVCAPLVSAAVTGLASGDIGQALKAGAIAAATAAVFNVVGDLTGGFAGTLDPILKGHGPLGFLSDAQLFNIAGHAAVGCGSAVASGGKCGPGALSGAIGSFAGPIFQGLKSEAKLIATATVGGLASVAGGEKFGNGAVTAAFGYLYNELGSNEQRGYAIDRPGFWGCLGTCAYDQYVPDDLITAFKDLVELPLIGGIPFPKTWAGYPPGTLGSSSLTTPYSVLGDTYKFMSSKPFLGTRNVFRMIGRATPLVAVPFAAYDAGSISYCTYSCTRNGK